MDTAEHHRATFSQDSQRGGHEFTGRREDNRGIKFDGRFIGSAANYREVSGFAEILLWILVGIVFLTPLPLLRAAPERS